MTTFVFMLLFCVSLYLPLLVTEGRWRRGAEERRGSCETGGEDARDGKNDERAGTEVQLRVRVASALRTDSLECVNYHGFECDPGSQCYITVRMVFCMKRLSWRCRLQNSENGRKSTEESQKEMCSEMKGRVDALQKRLSDLDTLR